MIYFFRQQYGIRPPVHTAATLFQKMCYENKDNLSAGIIVAGWDKEAGPSVYNIPVGGGLFRQPWAIGGKELVSLPSNTNLNVWHGRLRIHLCLWIL
jgi:20S proteasome alpha/beta subunit